MTGAEEYGKALFMLAEEEKITDRIKEELEVLMAAISESPDYLKLLDTHAVSKSERLSLVDEAFGSFSVNLKNLIKILSENRCAYLLPSVSGAFIDCYYKSRGILPAEAVTAIALTDAQMKALTERLEAKTGKTVLLSCRVDPSILGGVVLRYSDTQLDGSVKTRLDKFEEALSNIIV